MNKKLSFFLLLIGFYLLSTGVSFAVFKFAKGKTPVLESPLPAGDLGQGSHFPVLTGPKDQTCPLNGAMFTKTEKDLWSARRPMAVMIENHTDSRPQSGLSKADVVYEAVAEGAITPTAKEPSNTEEFTDADLAEMRIKNPQKYMDIIDRI